MKGEKKKMPKKNDKNMKGKKPKEMVGKEKGMKGDKGPCKM